MSDARPRPAFYALAPSGWRDYVTILHVPYTLWHLSYVVIGAALAPAWRPGRLGLTLIAFFLALGICAHALDELRGRPLRTQIRSGALVALAVASLGGAVAIGVVAALRWTPWLLLFVATGAFLVVAYNLELFGGRFHSDAVFALAWGAFPLLTAYVASAERVRPVALAAAGFALAASAAQRLLSTPVRRLRRGGVDHPEGSALRNPLERALTALTGAMILLAVALAVFREM